MEAYRVPIPWGAKVTGRKERQAISRKLFSIGGLFMVLVSVLLVVVQVWMYLKWCGYKL